MIVTFEDDCWSLDDDVWRRSLVEVLVLLAMRQQHSVWANPAAMLPWCGEHLRLHTDYFKVRLASAVSRANSLKISVSPTGASVVAGDPPWALTASAACELINRPLRVVLENDHSDRLFIESTVQSFSRWRANGWLTPAMGGGSAMKKDIAATAGDVVARWRTFYLFDSDRLHPSELAAGWTPPRGDSCQGHQFEVACGSIPRARWHRLERRSIENYLPAVVLQGVNAGAAATLFGASVGAMVHFYNVKQGLAGDGISPPNPTSAIRAARSQGFWTALRAAEITALETGFGPHVSNEFQNVPSAFAWPPDVLREMDGVAQALLDAI